MKYEHTLVLRVDLVKTFEEDNSVDLSDEFAKRMKQWLLRKALLDNVNLVRCQDFILEKDEAVDPGDWIRFDPEDRLTWPMEDEDLPGFSAPVITCTDDNCIHIGYIMHFDEDAEAESTWVLSNSAEDISLPLDSVIAWQPLPKPFHMEQEDKDA